MQIVTNHSGYNSRRNILDLPFCSARMIRGYDLFKVLDHICYNTLDKTSLFFHHLWIDFRKSGLMHLWNGISIGRRRWISTFEHFLPRWGVGTNKGVVWGLRKLTEDRCKSLVAMSNWALREQDRIIKEILPGCEEEILKKIQVMHPPQSLLIENFSEKILNNDFIQFILIGHEFFRKGGGEVLRVFNRLLKQGAPIKLTIVSQLKQGDYATRTTENDLADAHRLIANNHQNIVHHESLPYSEVLQLFRSSHIGLMPSWDDSYGYSVIEAQAAGCPVITTDICALSEINSTDKGWVLNISKNPYNNRAIRQNCDQRKALSEEIEEKLYRTIRNILEKSSVIAEKGENAIKYIRNNHDPISHVKKLEYIYRQSVN